MADSIQQLEQALVNAHKAAINTEATPEARALAQGHAQTLAKELKRQRGLQGVDVNVPKGEFEYAISQAPAEAPGLGQIAREAGTSATLGTIGQAIGSVGDTEIGPKLGASGGMIVGNLINQLYRMADDPNYKFKWGELGSEAAMGFSGAGPALATTRGAVAGSTRALSDAAIRQGLTGLAAGTARKATDEGKVLTGPEALTEFAIPAAGGAASQYLLSRPSTIVGQAKPSVRSQTLEGAREERLKFMPSETMPSGAIQQMEKIAGPASLRQKIQIENAPKIKASMNRYLGLPEETDVTVDLLKKIREDEGQVYAEATKIADKARGQLEAVKAPIEAIADPHARAVAYADPAIARQIARLERQVALDPEIVKSAKFKADEAFDAWHATRDPDMLLTARKLREDYNNIAKNFEKGARSARKPDLADRLFASRERIAKTYTAQQALNRGDAGYDPKALAAILNRDDPLSGEALKIAKFTEAFGRNVAEQGDVGTSGGGMISGFFAPAIISTETLLRTGRPGLAAAAAFAPGIAKEMATKRLLSEAVQSKAAEAIAPKVFINPNTALTAAGTKIGSQILASKLATSRPVTQRDIAELRANPALAKEFDEKFGEGEADKYLLQK